MLLKTWGNTKLKTRQEIKGDIEDLIPEILVSQASASTITNEGDNTNPDLLTTRPQRAHNTDSFAIEVSRLWKKFV